MTWLRRMFRVHTSAPPARSAEPSHEEWLRGLLEELRSPIVDAAFKRNDRSAIWESLDRRDWRELLEPFISKES